MDCARKSAYHCPMLVCQKHDCSYVSSATMQTLKQTYFQVTTQEFCMVERPRKSTELGGGWALT